MIVPTSYPVGKLYYRLERQLPRVRLSPRESHAISDLSETTVQRLGCCRSIRATASAGRQCRSMFISPSKPLSNYGISSDRNMGA